MSDFRLHRGTSNGGDHDGDIPSGTFHRFNITEGCSNLSRSFLRFQRLSSTPSHSGAARVLLLAGQVFVQGFSSTILLRWVSGRAQPQFQSLHSRD